MRAALSIATATFFVLRGIGPGSPAARQFPESPHAGWFKSLRDPIYQLPCCDQSDCKLVDFRIIAEHYEVLIDDEWRYIPQRVIISNAMNPMGQAVACYFYDADVGLTISCFVPGPGA
jgi:hypothetical protein